MSKSFANITLGLAENVTETKGSMPIQGQDQKNPWNAGAAHVQFWDNQPHPYFMRAAIAQSCGRWAVLVREDGHPFRFRGDNDGN